MTNTQAAILLYPRFTALDAIGPYEVLQRIPSIDITFVAAEKGEIRTENGMLGVTADASIAEIPHPDIVIVPGGIGTRELLDNQELLDWVRTAHESSTFTTSVCTGSLLLAAAGLLPGLTATTHWGATELLRELGAVPVPDRVVEHLDRHIITAAGVSSGIDMALRLAELLVDTTAAQAAQLMIEYDPQPPFDTGSLPKALAVGDELMQRVGEYAQLRS